MSLTERYKSLSYESKLLIKAAAGLIFSALLAAGKLVVGLFTDYNLISVALYAMALLLAKAECILGAKRDKLTFKQRNILTAAFLFVASSIYIAFMCGMFFTERRIRNNSMGYVLILAFISFMELGFAIAGLFRTKDRGHYFRNIKIIDFCIALIAILTTQMSILNMMSGTGVVSIANAYSGIAVGCFIALCAVYILIAPKTSVVGREHAKFVLKEAGKNDLVDMGREDVGILLCRSFIYGDYVFRAKITSAICEGDISRTPSLWKRMNIYFKILCCVLSEILIFVWLIGRLILFFRTINLPDRLEKVMRANGFMKVPGD